MVEETGRRQVPADWNDTGVVYHEAAPLARMFEVQADRTPDETALTFGGERLTYGELDGRANRLAHRLVQLGVGSDVLVGICAERSVDTVVSVLAVLKAGGAYLPLDPEYPRARLAYMVKDSRLSVLLTNSRLLGVLPGAVSRTLCLDRLRESLAGEPGHRPGREGSLDDLGYVIYTSGSTGRPKGVAMGQRPLANLVAWHLHDPRLSRKAATVQFTPLSFDVSFQEIFTTLCSGGSLHLISDEERLDASRLIDFMKERSIERLFLPFVALHYVAETANGLGAAPASLRDVVTAGEPLQVNRTIADFFRSLPECVLHNHYGPTETHVVTSFVLTGSPNDWPPLPPIGRPIGNTRMYILDDAMSPVAVGEEGQLYIGGDALARGYLHRPDLTAERFIPDPFSDDPAVRLYNTGDLARYRDDGSIDFLGRRDSQVKVRGYRIEPGEIEVVLSGHPAVRQAVVTAREDEHGEKRLVAYVLPREVKSAPPARLRRFLRERVPDYMMPAAFVLVDDWPRTPSGKIDRRALPPPAQERPDLETAFTAPRSDIETVLAGIWGRALRLDVVGIDDNFFELGGNSLLSLRTIAELRQDHGLDLPVARLFQQPTIRALGAFLSGDTGGPSPLADLRSRSPRRGSGPGEDAVAVIGMSGRFPGAPGVDELWDNLCRGTESITFFRDEELHPGVDPDLRGNPDYVPAKGVLDDADKFDAAFFGISPREAEIMDPQHRVFLEVAWHALEHAGCDPAVHEGMIGVYAGTGNNTYYPKHVLPRPDLVRKLGEFQTMVANEKDYLATRVAYKLNLTGPAVSLYTACSTSLAAIVHAFDSLVSGQCDMALAGGISIATPQNTGYLYQEDGMLSKDGHCRPFDAEATGTTFNNGAGIVVLKRLADAIADGDRVWAVMRGGALNNDGAGKMSFTAPSVDGQARVVALAHAHAGVTPDTISFVEAHGTATPLGDPIEVAALTQAFRAGTESRGTCALGSIKGNVGHLIAAAGVAGFIKTVLALRHSRIPPTLFFHTPNRETNLADSPFYVNTELLEWPEGRTPRRAGVSSFGVGGTNAHVILEEAPPDIPGNGAGGPSRPAHLLLLSAKTPSSLDAATAALTGHLRARPGIETADAAFTLQTSRRAFPHRRFVVCRSPEEAAEALESLDPGFVASRRAAPGAREVAFMFPGQGAQSVGMGQGLYGQEPIFRNTVDRCAEILEPLLGRDLRGVLYPDGDAAEAATLINETWITQPALFSIEYALSELWRSWGVEPQAAIGHSIGEFVAACIAGVFSLEDALRLVAVRGRMMQDLPGGSMLSVRLSAEDVVDRLGADLSVAAVNGPSLCVVSGPDEAVAALQTALKREKVACRALRTSHAFHSPMMDPIVEPFLREVEKVPLSPPRIPFVSTVTSRWIEEEQAVDPGYWARHLRAAVRFADGVRTLWEDPSRVLLESGPGTTAVTLARQQATDLKKQIAIPSLGRAADGAGEWIEVMKAMGQLWLTGVNPDWDRFYARETRRRVVLPGYSFERKRHWIEEAAADRSETAGMEAAVPETAAGGDDPVPAAAGAADKPAGTGKEGLIPRLKEIMEDASGLELQDVDESMTFFDMGMDSLYLTQVALTLQRAFSVKVTFRQLLEDYTTLDRLAGFLDGAVPADAIAATPTATVGTGDDTGLAEEPSKKSHGAAARIDTSRGGGLSPEQQKALELFIEVYTARTRRSKELAQKHRPHLADPRVVSGFRQAVKETVYPIAVERSAGARLWDVDGNEYIDLTCGFGSNFFGNGAPFVVEAVTRQLETGFEIGPQHPLAGEVARMICDLTGFDRAAFCNTGSEAVLGALRLARTVTGRNLVAIFEGSYHGIFDEVIVRGTKKLRSVPAAAGVPPSAVENTLVLDYGTAESLEILKSKVDELAAILVEPVQSRRPDLQPIEFLRDLRILTEERDTALIFDEVITGFRVHPAGAQGMFGLRADIGTYGKVVGGGLPIGVIAGRRKYMDALDGGFWRFGDRSFPEAGVTYFAGTFVRHPLVLAAARAALAHLKEGGGALQEDLNRRTDALVTVLNESAAQRRAPVTVTSFGSLFKVGIEEDVPNRDLFYAALRHRGIHIWDHRPCFLTLAHTDDDVAAVAEAFRGAMDELLGCGLLPHRGESPGGGDEGRGDGPPVPGARLGRNPGGTPAWYVPDPDRPGRHLKVEAS